MDKNNLDTPFKKCRDANNAVVIVWTGKCNGNTNIKLNLSANASATQLFTNEMCVSDSLKSIIRNIIKTKFTELIIKNVLYSRIATKTPTTYDHVFGRFERRFGLDLAFPVQIEFLFFFFPTVL